MCNLNTHDDFLESLDQYYPLTVTQKQAILAKVKTVVLTKGTNLIEFGKHVTSIWFLKRGYAKETARDPLSSTEWISWLWFPGDYLLAHHCFFSGRPAVTTVELISDAIAIEISFKNIMEIRHLFPELTSLIEHLRSNCEQQRFNHAAERLLLSAQERFDRFYANHKEIFNVARHKDIASFLSIKDHGLNRYMR